MAADTVVLATRNAAKLRELARILRSSARVAGLAEFPGAPDVPETGATFEENALLKARAIARYTGLPAVADDSGLCVDALSGMPGVLSARWAGAHGDDRANLELVLAQVADVPDSRLGAQFVCAAALALPPAGPAGGRQGQWVVTGQVAGPDPDPARQRRVRLRPDLPARRVRADHGRDDPGRQGRDQPPWPRLPRTGPVHRRGAQGGPNSMIAKPFGPKSGVQPFVIMQRVSTVA